MTPNQVVDLLSAAVAYDNRNVAESTVLAWAEAADRARWDFEDALAAVHEHYASSTEFLMPGHITARIRASRSQPAPFRELEGGEEWRARPGEGPNPTGPPARPEHIAEVIAKLAVEMGWQLEMDRRAWLAVACPFCGEQPGHECTRPTKTTGTGVTPIKRPHSSRIEAADAASLTEQENPHGH